MAPKVGDTVRYLNAVGGGKVVRIQGDIAYVDEDGFETPVLARECVVVATPAASAAPKATSAPKHTASAPIKDTTPAPTRLPVVETSTGEKINMVLGFEATDLKTLSMSEYEAYLVNDSNYYVFVTVAAKATDDNQWKLWYDGIIEPNIQEFLFELKASDLTAFDRLSVQYVAFKRGKNFTVKVPGNTELKVDTTKFAKLHCFKRNEYFDNPVIAFEIVCNDKQQTTMDLSPAKIEEGMKQKAADLRKDAPKTVSKPKEHILGPYEVDLHASELFDNINGLEPGEILNAQIDKFETVMREHIKRPGTRIIFIHGKGDGVLKQAIQKELTHRFKGHDVQDAPFEKYGYGATQVTIRYIATPQDHRGGKRR